MAWGVVHEARRGRKARQPARREGRGEALSATGERAALYHALPELTCSPCGNVIREGELFTSEAESASSLPLVIFCRACAPFTMGGGLLDALLAPDGAETHQAPRQVTRVRR